MTDNREDRSFEALRRRVIGPGLCTACGGCAGVCPAGAITFRDRTNACVPQLSGNCVSCGLCAQVCAGAGMDVRQGLERLYACSGAPEKEPDQSYFLCHAADEKIWLEGASGGFVTAALISLVESGAVQAAAVVSSDPEKPWLPKAFLASTREEILRAAQSRYCVLPTLEILREIRSFPGKVAMVLLPCQAQTLLKIRAVRPELTQNIALTIGLMCGNALPLAATKDVLRSLGIRDITRVTSLKYRDGLWSGELRASLDDGTQARVPVEQYMRWMADYYRRDRCRLCVDGDAWLTDLSAGDGWLPGNKRLGVNGWTIVHTHTKMGEELLEGLCHSGTVEALPLTERQAREEKHMYGRALSALPRIENRRRAGRPAPVYTGIPGAERCLADRALRKRKAVDFLSGILYSRGMKALLSLLPLRVRNGLLQTLARLWFGEK